jgi:hypothetical protein
LRPQPNIRARRTVLESLPHSDADLDRHALLGLGSRRGEVRCHWIELPSLSGGLPRPSVIGLIIDEADVAAAVAKRFASANGKQTANIEGTVVPAERLS